MASPLTKIISSKESSGLATCRCCHRRILKGGKQVFIRTMGTICINFHPNCIMKDLVRTFDIAGLPIELDLARKEVLADYI